MPNKIDVFCAWESGFIGVNVNQLDSSEMTMIDMSREEALTLAKHLLGAVDWYDQLEKLAEEHDQYVEENEVPENS